MATARGRTPCLPRQLHFTRYTSSRFLHAWRTRRMGPIAYPHRAACCDSTFLRMTLFMFHASICRALSILFHASLQVVLLVEPTDSALALYASWVATGARDRGLSLLDAWPQTPASAAPPTNPTTIATAGPGAPPSPPSACTALPAAAPPPSSAPRPGRVFRLEVGEGEMAILPGGWPYAAAAASDCVAVCGHLLHAHALAAQLRCWELEDLLRVRHRARFPLFRHVMWHAAVYYNRVLRSAAGGAG